jgi:hypothetical protein
MPHQMLLLIHFTSFNISIMTHPSHLLPDTPFTAIWVQHVHGTSATGPAKYELHPPIHNTNPGEVQ